MLVPKMLISAPPQPDTLSRDGGDHNDMRLMRVAPCRRARLVIQLGDRRIGTPGAGNHGERQSRRPRYVSAGAHDEWSRIPGSAALVARPTPAHCHLITV